MTNFEVLQIITGFLGTLGFGILFNVRGVRLLVASIGGLLSWFLFVVLSNFIGSEAVNFFLVALLVSIFAEIMARILKTPATVFATLSIIPLIPGSSLYYTMAYAFESDLSSFIIKAADTLKLAAALALGIITAITLTKIFFNIFKPKNKVKEK